MRLTIVLLLLSFIAVAGAAPALAQSFEDLIEDALRRQQLENQPAGPTELLPPAPPGSEPPPPALVPVEPGPRPYTPPTIARPSPGPAAPAAPGSPPTAEGSVPPTAEAGAPAPITPQNNADGAQPGERLLASLTAEEVNAATFSEDAKDARGANPLILKAQVLLDRAGASPGVIDGFSGNNVAKAVAAVETVLGLPVDGVLERQVWDALGGDEAPPVLVSYQITGEDASYPFLPSIPADFAEQAKLPNLGYTSPEEMFGERFHMHVNLLKALNPNADFRRAGTMIWVAAVEGQQVTGKIVRIVADKGRRQVRAYDQADRLIVAYPATIGSPDNPSPTGEHVVEGVAADPVYYYDPANFLQGQNTEKLQLPPGPNNPVGSVWIDLSEPSYGIHGTPEPAKIDKTGSHGCVRLTNWDAEELAGLVEPGVIVSFAE